MKRIWAGVVAGVLAGGLAGCSVHPGVAAIVGDRTITQEHLEDAAADLGYSPTDTLFLLIAAPYVIDAATDNGVGVSVADARSGLEARATQAGTQARAGAGAIEVWRFALAVDNLQGLPDGGAILADVESEVFGLELVINPRYGELDRTTGEISAAPLPWIVTGE